VPASAERRPAAVPVTIAACAALALALRAYQLSRPGYLLGVTEYDDGVLFGNALRLVSGVIPYRDFAMVQPPGSALLMAPIALLAKVTGTAWGLAVARILTVFADTANVVLLGVLVRHRGPHAVPVTLASSATGTISSALPGGCTIAKSRYGTTPLARRSALPNRTPSSYSVTPSR
jgi:alpha-1,2-mannosyltransferase